jgi:hypothetical protein
MPSFWPAQFHRKSTPESTPIPTTIGRGFGVTLPTEKTPGKSADAGLRVDLRRFSFTTPSGQSISQSAKLWLIGGIPMDDVVTVLEVRRRFEIPAALCSAPGREIAPTAQKVIARRKTV